MRLCLMRHGEAVDKHVDRARPLSPKGRQDVANVASQLRAIGMTPHRIFHSHKTRAVQTAEILHEGLDAVNGIEPIEGLAPGDPPAPIVARVSGLDEDVVFVGHLPSLEDIAAALLGRAPPHPMPTSGALILEKLPPGNWHLIGEYRPGRH